ncbi:DUF6882 domain-containing protein [Saccharicrinis sp. FJH62]|uniref:DUF6882 domain-containing protein n=1 Tax=Saccharicrinis sp. FJH62 TaxID=3344657 RepID=UPI0035D4F5F5
MRHPAIKIILIILITMGLFSSFKKQKDELTKPEITEEFRDFLTTSYNYLTEQQEICNTKFGMGNYERWDYNQETGLLEFSDSGIVKLRIKYVDVGSISNISNTWLWSWDNPNTLDNVKYNISEVREFGKSKGYERLTKSKWYGDEYDGWEMTAISAYILQAKGAYRVPTGDLFSFMIFTEIEDLRNND